MTVCRKFVDDYQMMASIMTRSKTEQDIFMGTGMKLIYMYRTFRTFDTAPSEPDIRHPGVDETKYMLEMGSTSSSGIHDWSMCLEI